MEKKGIIYQIKSNKNIRLIFRYIKDDYIKYKLFFYSKRFQKKFGMTKKDYKIKFIESLKKIENTNEFLKKTKIVDKLNLIKYKSKNFILVNSIKCFVHQIPRLLINMKRRISSELKQVKENFVDNEGFQIYGFKENKLIGAIEGPPGTSFKNGFFIFEIIIGEFYPFKPIKFYFKTKIFHPNIGEDGLVSLDIFDNNWAPSLGFKSSVLSVQSILDSPNPDVFLNENAAKLYKENRYQYEETVKDYIIKYANFFIFEDELSKYGFKIKHINIKHKKNNIK